MKFAIFISLVAGFTAFAYPARAEVPACDPISKYTTEVRQSATPFYLLLTSR
jgi:hypothetical protein